MFGLALRTYQKKIQRLAESATEHGTTLWEAVLDFVTKAGTVSRRELLEAFSRESESDRDHVPRACDSAPHAQRSAVSGSRGVDEHVARRGVQ